jgi:hypothetical protein
MFDAGNRPFARAGEPQASAVPIPHAKAASATVRLLTRGEGNRLRRRLSYDSIMRANVTAATAGLACALLALLALLAGCATLPSVSFVADDAGLAALDATTSIDGSGEGVVDGAPSHPFDAGSVTPPNDAGPIDSGGALDAGPSGTCPAAPPAGATLCCGNVPCEGMAKKCMDSCTNCENDCNAGQTCCLDKNGNFEGCFGTPSECP